MSDNYNSGLPAKNIHQLAADLAAWTKKTLVNRSDVYGCYINGAPICAHATLTTEKLIKHYHGHTTLGVYACTLESTGRFVALDIDAHDGPCPANLAVAMQLYQVCKEHELQAILEDSNGQGGFHLILPFSDYVANEQLISIAKWVQDLAEVKVKEIFPKQAKIRENGVGSFLRLPGKHHKKPHVSRIWNGKEWASLEHLLTFSGNDIIALPDEALTFWKAPVWTDLQQAYGIPPMNSYCPLSWPAILEPHGWRLFKQRGEVKDWSRPGVTDHHSATTNYMNQDTLYVFTDAAKPFEQNRSYNKLHAYALLNTNGDISEAKKALGIVSPEQLLDELFSNESEHNYDSRI